ncbi:MAG: class I SAM-dependent methyltransferase [Deltaproteobacteria bacterium]|nr:class I SAM-dependent methyltransferase [Deltaproteobacteria bacterium]
MTSPTPACALCGLPTRFRTILGCYPLCRCEACDLEFIHPIPPQELLARVYAHGYFQGTGERGYCDYFGVERERAARKGAAWLDRIQSHGGRGGRLLDLGCAAGYFLEAALARGFDPYGVEPSGDARGKVSSALAGRVFPDVSAVRDKAPFDVITAWDVLEHLADPLAAVRALAPLLRPGGLFAAVVPVQTNLNARLWPASWDQYKPPEHLWFFSPRSLSRLLCEALGAREVASWDEWSRPGRLLLERPAPALLHRLDRALFAPLRLLRPRWLVDSSGVLVRRA